MTGLMPQAIQAFINQDVPFLASSGNSGSQSDEVNTYPAMLGVSMPAIVVGATDNDGVRAAFSHGRDGGPYLATSAPGYKVRCPPATGDGIDNSFTGTSFGESWPFVGSRFTRSYFSLHPHVEYANCDFACKL
jgi:hypothetical protein